MINLQIELDKNQVLKKIIAKGHGNFSKKGTDIVCSAVSILLYTTELTLVKLPEIKTVKSDNKKLFTIYIKKYNIDKIDILKGVTFFLLNGLNLLKKEFNDKFDLKINNKLF